MMMMFQQQQHKHCNMLSSSLTRMILLVMAVWCLCLCSTNHPCVVTGFGGHHSQTTTVFGSSRTRTTSATASTGRTRTRTTTTQLHLGLPKIDEWEILKTGAVKGTVSNHPTLPDGYEITTSPLEDNNKSKNVIKNNAMVVTASGSKYKLLTALVLEQKQPTRATLSIFGSQQKQKQPKEEKKQPAAAAAAKSKANSNTKAKPAVVAPKNTTFDYDLNGKVVVGNSNGKQTQKVYLLVGKLIRSSSKRSQIYYAYEADRDGNPSGNRLTVKLTANTDRLIRENKNYDRVASKGRVAFSFKGSGSCFVRKVDFIPNVVVDGSSGNANANDNGSLSFSKGIPKGSSALVLESGDQNLRTYVSNTPNGLTGSALRKAAVNVCRCVEAMHSSGLVWTDLKAENFVLTEGDGNGNGNNVGEVKGIDLESAVPIKSTPEDYSPEACPPEFAVAEKAGRGGDFKCVKNYDSWSVGMLLFELSTGRNYFKGLSESVITNILATTIANGDDSDSTSSSDGSSSGSGVNVDAVADDRLRDLIRQCLNINPNKRPSIGQILLHPYFLTTGIGPFTF